MSFLNIDKLLGCFGMGKSAPDVEIIDLFNEAEIKEIKQRQEDEKKLKERQEKVEQVAQIELTHRPNVDSEKFKRLSGINQTPKDISKVVLKDTLNK